jgi:hypothetical protein
VSGWSLSSAESVYGVYVYDLRYFASRPEMFSGGGGGGGSDGTTEGAAAGAAAATAVHRALASNPETTSRLVSAGVKHGVPKSSPYSAAVSRLFVLFFATERSEDVMFHDSSSPSN